MCNVNHPVRRLYASFNTHNQRYWYVAAQEYPKWHFQDHFSWQQEKHAPKGEDGPLKPMKDVNE